MNWYREFYGGDFDRVVGFPDEETARRPAR